jgi:RNA polymerase sigma-70 factor (ECF subfamily)
VGKAKPETEIGGNHGYFQSTLWSVVLRAKDPESKERREALQKLIEIYWKPLYFFVRRKGNSTEASKDITQGFFAELLAKDHLKTLKPERGKFRTFLLTALQHYMADQYDRDRAQKRGGGRTIVSLDFGKAESEISASNGNRKGPEEEFRRDWAVHVMAQAMDAVRSSYASSGREAEFEAFKAHLSSTRPEGPSYEELAKHLGLGVDDVRNRVRSARVRYKEAILDVIRSYSDSSEDIRQELKDLLSAFS